MQNLKLFAFAILGAGLLTVQLTTSTGCEASAEATGGSSGNGDAGTAGSNTAGSAGSNTAGHRGLRWRGRQRGGGGRGGLRRLRRLDGFLQHVPRDGAQG